MQQYIELLEEIQSKGTLKPAARENMPSTQSLFGYQFRHNLQEGFPLLTTKKLSFKNIVVELLWFLRGDTNIKYLIRNGCNIWNEDAYNYYLKKCKESEMRKTLTFDEFIEFIKGNIIEDETIPSNYTIGECGFQYGKIWRDWETQTKTTIKTGERYSSGEFKYDVKYKGIDQIENLVKGLKNNPQSRRHLLTSIDPAHQNDLALYWCHALTQFNCRPLTLNERLLKGGYSGQQMRHYYLEEEIVMILDMENVPKYYLDCQMYQRSADVFLGVPYNIASYALLTHILAASCNMIAGEFIHTFGDVHIYENHVDQVNEQIQREPTELPTLEISKEGLSSIIVIPEDVEYIHNLQVEDFELQNYKPQARIKGKLSTGLK